MFARLVKLPEKHSFFLFGMRGVGKSTLVSQLYHEKDTHFINLLQSQTESRYFRNPDRLIDDIKELPKSIRRIVIDEVQKVPKLLDVVHLLIEEKRSLQFVLTGSSARKLKRGSANLLAGRAFLYYLHPLSHLELSHQFDLDQVLQWGSLPQLFELEDDQSRKNYLNAYSKLYLQEEILMEQLVRNINGFRNFLEIAAQMNGKLINYSSLAREAGIDDTTVKTYFQILEDTLLGFLLPSYHRSVRKAQVQKSKFYFFDAGLKRALEGSLNSPPVFGTSHYGQEFEAFVINEIYRANQYSQSDYRLSQYQTATHQEIDLILSRSRETLLIEIKSSRNIDEVEVSRLKKLSGAFSGAKSYYISQDPISSQIDGVYCRHWKDFIQEIFKLGQTA